MRKISFLYSLGKYVFKSPFRKASSCFIKEDAMAICLALSSSVGYTATLPNKQEASLKAFNFPSRKEICNSISSFTELILFRKVNLNGETSADVVRCGARLLDCAAALLYTGVDRGSGTLSHALSLLEAFTHTLLSLFHSAFGTIN